MAINTKEKRLAIMGWPGADSLPVSENNTIDLTDRLIFLGLPFLEALDKLIFFKPWLRTLIYARTRNLRKS